MYDVGLSYLETIFIHHRYISSNQNERILIRTIVAKGNNFIAMSCKSQKQATDSKSQEATLEYQFQVLREDVKNIQREGCRPYLPILGGEYMKLN